MTVNGQAAISAIVSNDPSASGVTWTVSCAASVSGGCGYILLYKTASGVTTTYTAPPFVPTNGTVTLKATSVADTSVSASTTVTITAASSLSIGFVPSTPTQVEAGNTVNLNAAVSNDSTNAGVDWAVTCTGDCGYFTTTPEIPAIAATTKTSYVAAVPAVTSNSVSGWPSGLPISYTAPSTVPANGTVVITAAAHAGSTTKTAASVTITSANSGPALQGVVEAGSDPVIGAQVALYAAGTTGYGSAATMIYAPGQNGYVTTGSSGKFTITGGYQCPSSASQMYLLSIGGQAGTNGVNENLVLMTLLGPCGALSSSSVVINEVTTMASAWSVAPFAANPLSTGLTSYLYLGSSSSNKTGLANAFASFNNLVNPATGQVLFTTPAGNAIVPYAEINILADILNACAVTGGGASGDGSACGNLFYDANPYVSQTGTEYSGIPTDTLQAAFEIVQNSFFQGKSTGNQAAIIQGAQLYAMATLASPFQPILSSEPNDFSLSLNFTGGGGLSSTSSANYFAIDNSGDLWITNAATSNVTEWNNQGAAMTSSSSYTTSTLSSPGPIAIDTSGNAWICGKTGLTELNFVGEEYTEFGSPFGGGGLTSAGCLNMAIDGSGNIWATNSASVVKFDQYGDAVSPSTGYTLALSPTNSNTATVQEPLTIDDSGNVWVGVSGVPGYTSVLSLAELNNASGEPNYLSPDLAGGELDSNFVSTGGNLVQTQIAADKSGNIWVPYAPATTGEGLLLKVSPYGGTGTRDTASTVIDCMTGLTGSCPLADPVGIAIDGGGTLWIGNPGSGTNSGIQPNLTAFNPSLANNKPGYVSTSLANQPLSIAVDNTGNVWLLLNNNTVTEFVGIATPAVTPLSLAVKKQKLGAKP
jgi:hypothetical protein